MKRNQLIDEAGKMAQAAKNLATINDDATQWAMYHECAAFGNDLCNVPNKRNMEMGAVTYTIPMAKRTLAELRARV